MISLQPESRSIRPAAARWVCTVLLALCAGLAGCRDRSPPTPRPGAAPPAAGFPRTVALPDGSEVELADRPRRVVVANTALVDASLELLATDRIVALCDQARTWSSLAAHPEIWAGRPTFRHFDAETILAYSPDLVLCSPFSQLETVHVLRGLGIQVVKLADPTTIDELGPRLTLLGRLFDTEERAAELRQDLDARIAALRTRAASREHRPSLVAYSRLGEEGWTMGSGTLIHAAIELAGFENAVAAVGREGARRLPLEDLLALDPEWLLVPAAFGEEDGLSQSSVQRDPRLARLRARRNDRIVAIHPWLFSTTSHEIVTAAEQLAVRLD